MRHLDEILSIFPGQIAPGKRFLLRRLERQPVPVDGSVALRFLREAETGETGDFARLAEERFYRRFARDRLHRASGDRTEEAGEWSRFFGMKGPDRAAETRRNLEATAAVGLAALLPGLGRCLRVATPGVAGRALKVLGRLRVPASLEAITAAAGSDLLLHDCMAALAAFKGDRAAAAARRLAAAWEGTPWFASLLYAFRDLPSPENFDFLAGVAGDSTGGPPVAVALEGYADYDLDPLLEPALTSEDPWMNLQAVETLGRVGGRDRPARITRVLREAGHPLVKVAALQALASTDSADAGEGALAGLEDAHPLVQAAAIESLVTLPVPRNRYRDRVLALLGSENPRLAMNAALACVVLDPKRAAKRIHGLLRQGSASHLMQGIHSLAYMDHPSTAGILSALIRRTEPGPLRLQAVRALGRHAADNPTAAEPLAACLAIEDAEVRRTAAWFLAGSEDLVRGQAVADLTGALQREGDPETQAVYLQALAIAGPKTAEVADAIGRFLTSPDPVAPAAAFALATAAPESDAAKLLDDHKDPALAAWGGLRLWITEGAGVGRLAALLQAAPEDALGPALAASRLAAEAATFADGPGNLMGLAAALEKRQAAPGAAPVAAPPPPPAETGEESATFVDPPPPPRPPPRLDEDGLPLAELRLPSLEESAELIASGAGELRPLKAAGFDGVGAQLLHEGPGGGTLPTADEADEALSGAAPSATEVLDAVQGASYFSMDREELKRALRKGAPSPEEPEEPEEPPPPPPGTGAASWMTLYFLLAFLAGQAARLTLR